jgi:hypothetical protein
MIFFTSSTVPLKIPTPETLLPSETAHTIDNTPSARSAKFLRPCSQMIFSTPSSFLFGPAFRITIQYCLVLDSICSINSSVMVVMRVFSKCFIHDMGIEGIIPSLPRRRRVRAIAQVINFKRVCAYREPSRVRSEKDKLPEDAEHGANE